MTTPDRTFLAHTVGIGELARRTGTSVRALRYYEQHGLLRATRTSAGHRRFTDADAETVRRIRLLLDAGMPLNLVAQILPCFEDEGARLASCVADRLREQLTVVEQRRDVLDQQHDSLTRLQQLVAQ